MSAEPGPGAKLALANLMEGFHAARAWQYRQLASIKQSTARWERVKKGE